MNIVVIANIIAFIGAVMMVCIGLIKKKQQILLVQSVQFGIQAAANILLGGVTGFISNLVSIARNLFCLKWAFTVPVKLAFVAVQVVLSLGVNKMGLLGWLPMISGCLYTWFLDLKDEVRLKIVMIIAQIMWVIYDFALMNYVSFAFDILTMISNLTGIWLILKDRREHHA